MKLLLYIFLISCNTLYPFSYDTAVYKAQKGNWQDAHVALNNIVTHNPDRADVVYDAGVVAYNLGNKCQAATCFARAAECSTDKNIALCAHFNAGNLYVDEKKLEHALEEYDKALSIEPDNQYARHNRDRVAQMLQEQQQQKDNQQDQKNKDEQNQDKQEQDNKNQCGCDNQNQDQQGSDNQNGENQEQDSNDQQSSNGNDKKDTGQSQQSDGQQNQKNGSSQDESSNQQAQGDREQRDTADGKDTQRQEHGNNKEQQHQDAANNEKRNGKDEFEKESKNKQRERNKQQGNQHGTTPEKQHEGNDKSNVSAQAGQEQADQGSNLDETVIHDPWLLNILNNQELHDKAVNKQLMEAKIRQHGGKNGQNCW